MLRSKAFGPEDAGLSAAAIDLANLSHLGYNTALPSPEIQLKTKR